MRLQVEQLEKEKKELNEKMRVLAKRLDHIERAYRKEERPLLAKDYEIQQANDRAVFEASQKARLEAHRQAHVQDVETKKRLTRMLGDYEQLKATIASRRGEEYAKKKELAQKRWKRRKRSGGRRCSRLARRSARPAKRKRGYGGRRKRRKDAWKQVCGLGVLERGYVLMSHASAERLAEEEQSGGGRSCPCRCRAEEARRRRASRRSTQAARRGAPASSGGRAPPAATRKGGIAEAGGAQGCRSLSDPEYSCSPSSRRTYGLAHVQCSISSLWC